MSELKTPLSESAANLSAYESYHGISAEAIQRSFLDHLEFTLAKDRFTVTHLDQYLALAYAVRDRLIERWLRTQDTYYRADAKRVYYLSMEFLMGRTLGNAIVNLNLKEACRRALLDLGYRLEDIQETEPDAGLGNGGLGRLAACFLDSMATLAIPGYGYGIRYEYGIFNQEIKDGEQVEQPDNWLRYGNPWEIVRPEVVYPVHYYGEVIQFPNGKGKIVHRWVKTETILAMAYDTPIPGYGVQNVNTLRLWSSKASREFDFYQFNEGDYISAVRSKTESETISKVLYPNDNRYSGKELRLKQEYFFVSATLQDIFRRYKKTRKTFDEFPDKVAIQLNDTHPAIAIAELMRIFVDVEDVPWEKAWELTRATVAYTNHTVLPEALEKWTAELLGKVLPRHLEIIYDINYQFLRDVRVRYPNNEELVQRVSLVEEPVPGVRPKSIRMANLAIVGSHRVNGVAALHTEIIKRELFKDFALMFPERFENKTNGITQRRWLACCNPQLASLITEAIGDKWMTDLYEMEKLIPFADDPGFRQDWHRVKQDGKDILIEVVNQTWKQKLHIDKHSIFDCQVKRIHEYKRQLLNLLHAITLYNRLRHSPDLEMVPRTIFFSGKAAPGYRQAKLIIRLINAVADVINNDVITKDRLRVVFLPNYRVSLAEKIMPGAELSEQISTAGMEASGTGNMKFALNGALTIGTLDGANIEIAEEVGPDNIFIFGLTVGEIAKLKPHYSSWDYFHSDPELNEVLNMIGGGYFSPLDKELFHPILFSLLEGGDQYFVLADYRAYVECQERVAQAYLDQDQWTRKSILNAAKMGKFSSDRTIQEYARSIWRVSPVAVNMATCDV
ncbi:glycogen/starch/alpha-glucan phosphorylase [Chloracidobacterium sp. MS 40/45]|uniref:glycogen/starch/alpha-glucan phosphorylase n=1 Tax=Chloracidobacterium aggregatum TaxID=2851959 RepID=UPI001B8C64FD|nr:glycogen/starch/alpha-glucan phosphorylase [Chloracidobacterium aggregatum]QUW00631.1 glycogen/starch/alpha-glucan phosphorylase [Chloracidobacterium sp. MS 40/45]